MANHEDLLDIAQAARLLRVSESSLRRWTNDGSLPCLRVGGRRERRFRRADLMAFAGEHRAESAARPQQGREPWHAHREANHLCGLYSSDEGRDTQAATFLAEGLRLRETCYLFAEPEVQQGILALLRKSRPSLDADIDAGRLKVGQFAMPAIAQIGAFEAELSAALRRGARAMRGVGDVWGLAQQITPEELIEYEAVADERISRRFPFLALCQYDVRKFSNLAVLDALKGHQDLFRWPVERVLA